MPQLVVAAGFAVAGNAVLGATAFTIAGMSVSGAAVGWTLGSIVGAQLFAPSAPDGPRIADKKVGANTYGQPMAAVYGTERVGCQILWSSELIESEDEVGGKGGGGATVYTYSVNVLIGVCESPTGLPIEAVLELYGNGRLIWKNDATADGQVDQALVQPGCVRVYLGGESQMPDPLYEAAVGTANAVAYRGQCVIMIEGLQLQFSGNRPPNFEAVVTTNIGATTAPPQTTTELWSAAGHEPDPKLLATDDYYVVGDTDDQWKLLSRSTNALVYTVPYSGVGSYGARYWPGSRYLWVHHGVYRSCIDLFYGPGPTWAELIWTYVSSNQEILSAAGPDECLYQYNSGQPMVRRYDPSVMTWDHRYDWSDTTAETLQLGMVIDQNLRMWGVTTGGKLIWCEAGLGGIGWVSGEINLSGRTASRLIYCLDRGTVLVRDHTNNTIFEVDESTGAMSTPISLTGYSENMRGSYSGGLYWLQFGTDTDPVRELHGIDLDTGTVEQTRDLGDWYTGSSITRAQTEYVYVQSSGCVISYDSHEALTGSKLHRRCVDPGSVAGGAETLATIVTDLCDRSGLDPADLDVTELTDLVAGFKLGRQTSARQAIQSLQPAYFFDGVESGLKLAFRKRGAPPAATIAAGELGARVWQATADGPEPAYELEHVAELEAPRELSVTYIDAAAHYDPGVQTARRQVGTSDAPAQLEIPVVLTADEAAKIAWANLLHAHASKNSIKLKLSHHYDALEGADPILIPLSDGTLQRIRLTGVTRARPLLEVDAVLEDGSIYAQVLGGVDRSVGPQQTTPGTLADTILALLDVPPLRDADDALLLYVAMAGDDRDSNWPGAALYKSSDGGTSYAVALTASVASTIGTTASVLGNWTGGNVWDETNTVDVLLTSGTFSSATELAVLNGANAVYIGGEIVQFRTAELITANTWRLSGLLRGRIGTEYEIAGHATGERVVLLSALSLATHEIAATAEVGQARRYKGVTSGQPVADVAAQTLTLAGNSLKPLSPVHIEGSRAGGDLTLTWIRRARVNAGWLDGTDVPLDEPTEAYEIDILDSGTVVRTITATTTTASYTAAQQTTDFGAPQAAIDVAIYQISGRVGRGHAGTATV